jgi:hypothetical protein
MNACLSLPTTSRHGRTAAVLVKRRVTVDFATPQSFEPHLNIEHCSHLPTHPMFNRSFSAKEPSSAGCSSQHSERMDSAATLKFPRMPDVPGFARWSEPAARFRKALDEGRHESDILDASIRAVNQCRSDAKIANRAPELKLAEFSVQLPDAATVQLAAEFTDWEKAPIDLIRFENGMWSTTVPLPPGVYSYRFLVDGRWFDDPRALRRNDLNAVIQIK